MMPLTGDFMLRSPTRRCSSCDDEPLTVALQATRAQLELQAFFLQPGGLDRVLVIDARGRRIVARLLEVALADQLLAPTNPRARRSSRSAAWIATFARSLAC